MRPDALAAPSRVSTARRSSAAQSGNVNTGAFDPLAGSRRSRPRAAERLAPRRRRLRPLGRGRARSLRQLVAGVGRRRLLDDRCHKWLNVPYDSGLVDRAGTRPPTRRRCRGRRLLRLTGRRGTRRRRPGAGSRGEPAASPSTPPSASWDAKARRPRRALLRPRPPHGRPARRDAAGVAILNDVVLNQVLVRFAPRRRRRRRDAFTRDVVAAVQADGTCWLGGTTWHGMAAMRISISNWSTTADDIDASAAAIRRCREAVAARRTAAAGATPA